MMLMVAMLVGSGAHATTEAPLTAGESVLTLRVDGSLSIDPEGRVMAYKISTDLDPQVEKMVRSAVPRWRFKPILVDGKPAIAESPMRITLSAVEKEQGFQVTVDNVVFRANTPEEAAAEQASRKSHPRMNVAGEEPAPLVWITSKNLRPPHYPTGMLKSGVEGIVLLTARLNPDGTVAEVFASQSSLLNVKGSPALLDRARRMLERNAIAAANGWTFEVTAEDPEPLSAKTLTVRVPVEYRLAETGSKPQSLVGTWRHEFRGPNLGAPWLADDSEPQIGVSDVNGGELVAGTSPFGLSDPNIIGKTL